MAPAAARVRDNRPDAGPPGPIPKDDLSIASVRGIAWANKPFFFFFGIVKSPETVTPAKAGVHNQLKLLDPRLRGDDEKIISATFYELIKG